VTNRVKWLANDCRNLSVLRVSRRWFRGNVGGPCGITAWEHISVRASYCGPRHRRVRRLPAHDIRNESLNAGVLRNNSVSYPPPDNSGSASSKIPHVTMLRSLAVSC